MSLKKTLFRCITIFLTISFFIQDVVWTNPAVSGCNNQQSINTLQVQSGFKPMEPEVYHQFLVSSYIDGIIGHLGAADQIMKRQFPVVKGMQLDLRFDEKYKDQSGNVIVSCILSSKKDRWEYEAVISPDGAVALRKQIKKTDQAKDDLIPTLIEELKNPNLSFLANILKNIQVKEIDYLVIGGGVGGLSCVAGLCQKDKDASILVISKGAHGQSSATQYAQGGAAVCISGEDSPQLHAKDTLIVGDGLGSPAAARVLATETPVRIRELISWGGEFDKDAGGSIILGQESGSSVKRIVHSKGAQTGEEIERILARKVMELSKENRKNIQIEENVFVIDLLIKDGRCVGALGLNYVTGQYIVYRARATALATGGVSRIYLRNTNPKYSTGDGTALAYRAGADLANMEMIQFHPTALSIVDAEGRAFLISERVRGDGARLMNTKGEYFMEKYHPKKEMAPRNVVARAVYWEMQNTKSDFVYLDTTPIKDFKTRFPKLYEECRVRGIDLDKSPLIPVAPASHFTVGGVLTDLDGKTTLRGLYAMGEVAYTGVHGADRMASNSLDEGLVFGRRSSGSMIDYAKGLSLEDVKGGDLGEKMTAVRIEETPDKVLDDIGLELGHIMQERVCLIRNKKDLEIALADVKKLKERFVKTQCVLLTDLELRNKLDNAEIIITNAISREESRGAHFRDDHQTKGAGKWQIFSKNGLTSRDLEVNSGDMAWLFRLPRNKKGFFGLDKETAKNNDIYDKALKNEICSFEIPDNSPKVVNEKPLTAVLSEALKKEGYVPAASSEALKGGEYFISDIKAKDSGASALKLYIKLLLNSNTSQGLDDLSGPSHRFPAWICRVLASKLPALLGKAETKFLLKDHGIGFVGIINDVPPDFRNSLKPKEYPNSIIIYEGAISTIAVVFKEILPKYYGVPLEEIKKELRQAIVYYNKVKLWIRDSGVDFEELKKNILTQYGEKAGGNPKFNALIRGVRRQYGYKIKSESILLRELAVQFITEAVKFNKLPQVIDDTGKEKDIDLVIAQNLLDFITENALVPESEMREKEIASIAALIEGKRVKEEVRTRTEELFGYLRTTYTSPENEKPYNDRVKAAFNKAEALEQGKRAYFQDEDAFHARNKQPLSKRSFEKLAAMYEQVNNKYAGLIYAVLGFMDVGKLVEFKNDLNYANLNFANHPEAGSYILRNKRIFRELGLSVDAEELALMLVKQHGFIGQSKRGEVTDEVFRPILQLAIERKDSDILKLYLLINVIDTSVVSEGMFTEDFFNWFFNKYLQLEEFVQKGIKEKKSAAEVLLEEGVLLTDKVREKDCALERMAGICPGSTKDDIIKAVERVFDGLPDAKQRFFTLLARQRNSFSLWYPESALSWLKSIDSEIKFIFLLLQVADLKCKLCGVPIDINLYDIAMETMRRDESRLSEENRSYIEKALAVLDVKKLLNAPDLKEVFDHELRAFNFEFDKNNNTIYAGFDVFAPMGLSLAGAQARVKELDGIVNIVTRDHPIAFIKKHDTKEFKKIGIFALSADPIRKTHKLLIEKALNEYNLEEIIVIVAKEHIIKDRFGASLAQRLFMLEQDTRDCPKVSIAVSQSGKFINMAKLIESLYPKGSLYFVMGFDNIAQMLDKNKSGNTKENLRNFFSSSHVLVVPRDDSTDKDLDRILAEGKVTEFRRSIDLLSNLPPQNSFGSSTEARRFVRDNLPENKLLSSTVIRIVKALGLYGRQERLSLFSSPEYSPGSVLKNIPGKKKSVKAIFSDKAKAEPRRRRTPYEIALSFLESSPENTNAPRSIRDAVKKALKEDLGGGDISAKASIGKDATSVFVVRAKEAGVLAGLKIAMLVCSIYDKSLQMEVKHYDGDKLNKGDPILIVKGNTRSLLAVERTLLNFLQKYSGIATLTYKFVEKAGKNTKILDTRKTTPGMRLLEKYAVKAGGGYNHRIGLYDMIMLKDNHIRAAGGITEAVRRVRQESRHRFIEVETGNIEEVREALSCKVDRIMLDNMDLETMRKAVKIVRGSDLYKEGKITLEASGNVTLETVGDIAGTGVDYISVGMLTHSPPILDINMKEETVSSKSQIDSDDRREWDRVINAAGAYEAKVIFQEIDEKIAETGLSEASALDRYIFIRLLALHGIEYLGLSKTLGEKAQQRLSTHLQNESKVTFASVAKELLASELEEGRLERPIPATPVLGMPKILLIGPYRSSIGEREIAAFLSPPLGIYRISSYVRQFGIKADVYDIDLLGMDGLLELVKKEKYDFIMFSTYHQTIANGLNGMNEVKKISPDSIIVAGGQGAINKGHVNNIDLMFKHAPVDVVVRGFGESAVLDMAVEFRKDALPEAIFGRIPGLIFKNGKSTTFPAPYSRADFCVLSRCMDFARIPYNLYWQNNREVMGQRDIFNMARLITESHCPFKCTFCSARKFLDIAIDGLQPVLYLAPEDIIHELNALIDAYPQVEAVYLHDDDFFLNKKRVLEFIDLIKQGKLKKKLIFFAQGRTDDMDKDLLRRLFDVGFRIISYGQESYSQKVLDDIKKDMDASKSAGILKDSLEIGILPHINLILFPPKATMEDVTVTIDSVLPLVAAGAHIAISGRVLVLPGASMAEEGYEIEYKKSKIQATGEVIDVPYLFQPQDPQLKAISGQADKVRDEKVAELKGKYYQLIRLPQQIDGLCYFWAIYHLAGIPTEKIDDVIYQLIQTEINTQRQVLERGRTMTLGRAVPLPNLDDIDIATPNNETNVQLLIVSDCQLRCRFCINYQFAHDGLFRPLYLEWDEKSYRKLLNKLKKAGLFELTLTGGEPGAHPYLVEFVRIAKEEGMRIRITSNGLRMTRDILMELKAAGLDNLTFSTFSFDELRYRKIAIPEMALLGNKGGTIQPIIERIKDNIRTAIELGIDPRLNIIVTRDAYSNGDIKNIIDEARKIGVRKFMIKSLSVEDGIRFTQDQFLEVSEDMLASLFPNTVFYRNPRWTTDDMRGFYTGDLQHPAKDDLSVVIFSFEKAKREHHIRDIFINPFAPVYRFATTGRDPKTSQSAIIRNGELIQLSQDRVISRISQESSMRLGLIHGRFQPPHYGHIALIQRALQENDRVLVIVGADKVDDEKNPIKQGFRVRALKMLFPQEIASGKLVVAFNDDIYNKAELVDIDWGQRFYDFTRKIFKEGTITVYTGPDSDRGWWNKFSDVHVVQSVERIDDISATAIRDSAENLAPDLSYALLREAAENGNGKATEDIAEGKPQQSSIIPNEVINESIQFGRGVCLIAPYERFLSQHLAELWGDGRTTGLARLAAFLSDPNTTGSGFAIRLLESKRDLDVYTPGMGLGILPQAQRTSLREQKVIVDEAIHEVFPNLILSPEWSNDEYDLYIYYEIASMVLSSLYSGVVALWHLPPESVKKGLSLLPEEEAHRSAGLIDLYREIDTTLRIETLEKLFHALLELNISGDERQLRALVPKDSKVANQIIARFKDYAKKDRLWFGALFHQRMLHPELAEWSDRHPKGISYRRFVRMFGGTHVKGKVRDFLLKRFMEVYGWKAPFNENANRPKALLNFFRSQEAIFYRFPGLTLTDIGKKAHDQLIRYIEELERDAANDQYWDSERIALSIKVFRSLWVPMIGMLYDRGFISKDDERLYERYYPYQENASFAGQRYNNIIEKIESEAGRVPGDIAEARIIERHFEHSKKYNATRKAHVEYPTNPLVSTVILAEPAERTLIFVEKEGRLALPERFALADESMDMGIQKIIRSLGLKKDGNTITLFDFMTQPGRSANFYIYTAVSKVKVNGDISPSLKVCRADSIDLNDIVPEHRAIVEAYLKDKNSLGRGDRPIDLVIDPTTASPVKKPIDITKDRNTTSVHNEFLSHDLAQPVIASDAVIEYYDEGGTFRGILLVKRSGDNHWATLGGFANRYESAEHAIERRIYDKIGFRNVKISRLLRLATEPDRDERLFVWAPAYVVEVHGEKPTLKEGITDYVIIKSETDLERLAARTNNDGGVWFDHLDTLRYYFAQRNKTAEFVQLTQPPFPGSADVIIDKVEEYNVDAIEKSVANMLEKMDPKGKIFDSVQTVLVKPSLASMYNAKSLTTTHPVFIEAVIRYLKGKGIRRIIFGDGGFHGGNMDEIFKELKLYDMAQKYGVELVDLNKCSPLPVQIPERPGMAFKKVNLASLIGQVDLIVNLPKLKTHGQMVITGALKNLKGVSTPNQKRHAHEWMPGDEDLDLQGESKLAQAIVDNATAVSMVTPKQLIIADGIEGMEGFGPTHGTKVKSNCIVMGTSPVSVDTTLARIMQVDPANVPSIRISAKTGYWPGEPTITGQTKIEDVTKKFVQPEKLKTKDYGHFTIVVPEDVTGICSACMGLLGIEHQLMKEEWRKRCEENGLKLVIYIGRIAPLEPLPEDRIPVYIGVCPGIFAKAKGVDIDRTHMVKVCAPGTATVMETINKVFEEAIKKKAGQRKSSDDQIVSQQAGTPEDASRPYLLRNLMKSEELSRNLIEMLYSIVFSGKRIVLAFSKNIKSQEAVRVVGILDRIKNSPRTDVKLKKVLDNIILLSGVASEADIMIKLSEQGINIDEIENGQESKNILALFAPKGEQGKFASLGGRKNVFYSYVDEGGAQYDSEYYPLPEIVTITLSNILDSLAGIDRLIREDDIITEIVLEKATLQLSDINIEKIKRDGSHNLIFVLLPKSTRYDFGSHGDRYALTEKLIKAAA